MYFVSLEIVTVIANSIDPDEMLHYAVFHLGLHYLPKNAFRSHFKFLGRVYKEDGDSNEHSESNLRSFIQLIFLWLCN